MDKWLPWAVATTTVCQQLLLKNVKSCAEDCRWERKVWEEDTENQKRTMTGLENEIRKSLEGQEDVRTVSSWEILHEVRPGKKMMGN